MTRDEVMKELTDFVGVRYVILSDRDVEAAFEGSYPIVFGETVFYQQFPWGMGSHYYYNNIEAISSTPQLKILDTSKLNLGSDPEFFFTKDGKVIPSNEVLSADTPSVKRDGIQGELNPGAAGCRQTSGSFVAQAYHNAVILANLRGAKVSLQQIVDVDDETWERTPDSAKEFGCHPTKNVYKENRVLPNGHDTRLRSAGGHIHLALKSSTKLRHNTLAKVLDIVVGNSWVLIDRDPANAIRRQIYGRAGEYRLKPYGLEYRVPSNFWLRHYILWSGVTATCRNAISLVEAGYGRKLLTYMDMDKVREAINTNNQELALENLTRLFEFLDKHKITFNYGFQRSTRAKFLKWATSKDPMSKFPKTDDEVAKHHDYRRSHNMEGYEMFISKF